MNYLPVENLAVLICAAAGFAFGARRYLRPKKPLYASMIVLGVGCVALGRLFQCVRLLTGSGITEEFQLGILGIVGAFSFFFSANYGQIDSLVDDGSGAFRKWRALSWAAPAVIAALYAFAAGPLGTAARVVCGGGPAALQRAGAAVRRAVHAGNDRPGPGRGRPAGGGQRGAVRRLRRHGSGDGSGGALMENVIVILFLCVAVPVVPVLALLPDRRSRLFLGYLLLGTAVCLCAAEINALLLRAFGGDMLYVTTNITPVSEEILKSLPVLLFAWAVTDERNTLVSVAFAVGLGFALLENLVILTQNLRSVSVLWAFARGLGAALMHSTCTSLVGMGASYIRKRRKLFWCGTFSLLTSAIIYHGVFNSLVQSEYRFLAFVLPAVICVPQLMVLRRNRV